MSDDEIIASMVKGRECCRRVVRAYEQVWDNSGDENESVETLKMLANARRAAEQMLMCLEKIPGKPVACLQDVSQSEYVGKLMDEIGRLLERAMVLEREVRNLACGCGTKRSYSSKPRAGAMRAYAGA